MIEVNIVVLVCWPVVTIALFGIATHLHDELWETRNKLHRAKNVLTMHGYGHEAKEL